jgi:hypothetical protein
MLKILEKIHVGLETLSGSEKKIIPDPQHCYLGKTRLTNGNGIVQHALPKDKSMKGDIHVQITEQLKYKFSPQPPSLSSF